MWIGFLSPRLFDNRMISSKVYLNRVMANLYIFILASFILSIQPRIRLTITYGVCIRRMDGPCKVVELAGSVINEASLSS